jgi:hypothetical protein
MMGPEIMAGTMTKAREFHFHADECLHLARQAEAIEHREMLLQMANTWLSLVDYCEALSAPQRVPAALSSFVPQDKRSSRFR